MSDVSFCSFWILVPSMNDKMFWLCRHLCYLIFQLINELPVLRSLVPNLLGFGLVWNHPMTSNAVRLMLELKLTVVRLKNELANSILRRSTRASIFLSVTWLWHHFGLSKKVIYNLSLKSETKPNTPSLPPQATKHPNFEESQANILLSHWGLLHGLAYWH